MLDKLYITPRQWLHILRWTLYAILFMLAMMLQTVVLGNRPIFGANADFIPVVIACVCMREGPERGGWFALCTALFWFLSGAESGSISIVLLTAVPILCSVLCRSVLHRRYMTCLLSSFVTLFALHTVIFLLKYLLGDIDLSLFARKLLPGVLVSLVAHPVVYFLVKKINRIGDDYEPT